MDEDFGIDSYYEDIYSDVDDEDYEHDGFLSDAEADADVLSSMGWGSDEDYEHNSFFDRDYED